MYKLTTLFLKSGYFKVVIDSSGKIRRSIHDKLSDLARQILIHIYIIEY
jgi:hypothetical protein